MKRFSTVRRVAHAPAEMFALVADVERYPEFVPYCEGLRVLKRRDLPGNRTELTCSMTLGYKMFNETFGCRVLLDEAALAIDTQYLDGPFSHLVNRWRFLPANVGCEIDFYIEYKLRSRSLALIVGAVFDRAFEKLSQSFEDRARVVYGDRVSA